MRLWLLVLGDIAMLVLFAFLGQSEHKTLTTFGGTLATAAPFIISWLLVGFLTGLYKKEHYENHRTMFRRTLPVWLLGIPGGLGLRALYLGKGIPLSFFAVAMTSTFILLFAWRSLYVMVSKRRKA